MSLLDNLMGVVKPSLDNLLGVAQQGIQRSEDKLGQLFGVNTNTQPKSPPASVQGTPDSTPMLGSTALNKKPTQSMNFPVDTNQPVIQNNLNIAKNEASQGMYGSNTKNDLVWHQKASNREQELLNKGFDPNHAKQLSLMENNPQFDLGNFIGATSATENAAKDVLNYGALVKGSLVGVASALTYKALNKKTDSTPELKNAVNSLKTTGFSDSRPLEDGEIGYNVKTGVWTSNNVFPKNEGSDKPVIIDRNVNGVNKKINVNNINDLIEAYKIRDDKKKQYGGNKKSIGSIDLETRKYATNPAHISSIKEIYKQVKNYDYFDMQKEFKRLNSPLQYISGDLSKALKYYGITPGEFIAVVRQDSNAGTRGNRAIENKNPGNVGNTDDSSNIKFGTWIEGSVAAIRNLAERKVS